MTRLPNVVETQRCLKKLELPNVQLEAIQRVLEVLAQQLRLA